MQRMGLCPIAIFSCPLPVFHCPGIKNAQGRLPCASGFINVVKCVGYSKDGRDFSSLITMSGGCE